MIVKNKTAYTQSVHLEDGSKVSARPYRTITLDEKVANSLDTKVWDVPKAESKAKVVESTTKGK